MIRTIAATIAMVGILLAGSAEAALFEKAASKCQLGLEKSAFLYVKDVNKILSLCLKKLEKCHQEDDAVKRDACVAKAKCVKKDPQVDLDKKTTNFFKKVMAKCKSTANVKGGALSDADFTANDIVAGTSNLMAYGHDPVGCAAYGVDFDAGLIDGTWAGICSEKKTEGNGCDVDADCDSPTGPGGDGVCQSGDGGLAIKCVQRQLLAHAQAGVADAYPRAFWMLDDAGVTDFAATESPFSGVPIGEHTVAGTTDVTLTTDVGTATASFSNTLTVDIGGVDGDGIATIAVPAASASFGSGVYVASLDATICVDVPSDGSGSLCCNPAGCAGLGNKSYSVEQDHDSTGASSGVGFQGGATDSGGTIADDPTCVASASNSVSTLPAWESFACSEGPAGGGSCAGEGIGQASIFAYGPTCDTPTDKFCDPAGSLADECPNGGTACAARGNAGAGSPVLTGEACNSPSVVTETVASSFGEGDMVMGLALALTILDHGLDVIDYGGSCSNGSGDSTPDGFGCDGVACTGDDNARPGPAVTIALTTGSADATVYDANMVPVSSGGTLATALGEGANPGSEACHRLSLGNTDSYSFAGAFTALGDPVAGDAAGLVEMNW
jgi:hypothetical protein